MSQENTHAVIYDPSGTGVEVLPLPLSDEDIPEHWELLGTYPSEADANHAAHNQALFLDPEAFGSIH
jgi:hypothetical protein